jgi:hypothetical protein
VNLWLELGEASQSQHHGCIAGHSRAKLQSRGVIEFQVDAAWSFLVAGSWLSHASKQPLHLNPTVHHPEKTDQGSMCEVLGGKTLLGQVSVQVFAHLGTFSWTSYRHVRSLAYGLYHGDVPQCCAPP